MNDKRIRYFDDFTELDIETKLKFSEFRKLNEILQSTKKSSYDIIYNWYINSVLAWDNQDVVSQEISRLIKHNYVALNSILEFGELKYPYVWDFITTQFTSLWIDETDAFQISEFLLLRNHRITHNQIHYFFLKSILSVQGKIQILDRNMIYIQNLLLCR